MITCIAVINIILIIWLVGINLLEDLGFQLRDKPFKFLLCILIPIIILLLEIVAIIINWLIHIWKE